MHTRGALRQDQEAEESTPERRKLQHHEYRERGAQDEPTGKGTEKPRVKESTHRRDPREETVEQPRGQREAGRRAAGKVAEAPSKPQGTVKDDDP